MDPAPAISLALTEGAQIGAYTLGERISQGDRGATFLARQEGTDREVALVVLSDAQLGPTALARFRYEVQALTALRHPGIAEVHETGIHVIEDGESLHELPWFAMEHVPGEPLPVHAEAQRLDQRARLELFVQVCDAVQHGHQKGVVHGGLAPERIIVDAAGRPKVAAFGVSRVLAPARDVRDDVRALGDVLRSLLGQPPRGDLAAIVETALEDDESQRYASANALAADLRRYLEHRPIEARAASPIYPMRLWTRRHRFITAAIALLVALSFAAAAVATVYAVRKHNEAEALRKQLDAIEGK